MNSSKFLLLNAICLALGCLLVSPPVEGKNVAPASPQPATLNQSSGFYKLNFPTGPPLAEILWNTRPEDAGKAKGRILASGIVLVPKNQRLEVILSVEALDHMDSIEQLAALPVLNMIAAKLDFTDAHMQHLKNFKSLAYLNLDETLVTDKSLPLIGTFTSLAALRLSVTDVTGSSFGALSRLSNLYNLNIRGITLKPGSLVKLKGALTHLTDFDLGTTNLRREDAAALTAAPQLRNLDVRGNKGFDDSCVVYLAALKYLKSLTVTDTSVTDKSLPELAKLPKLKSLNVRSRTFWRNGVPRESNGRLKIVDSATKSNASLDVFRPLH